LLGVEDVKILKNLKNTLIYFVDCLREQLIFFPLIIFRSRFQKLSIPFTWVVYGANFFDMIPIKIFKSNSPG